MTSMNIEVKTVKDIKLSPYNPRKDLRPGDPAYEKLKKAIMEFDIVEPLVWNKRSGNLIGGHQRLKILKELGVENVEVSVVDLPAPREKALNLALNKIQGEWDFPKLKDLLEELDTGEFDMEITGFDEDEREELLGISYDPYDIESLLEDLDLSKAIDKPLWVVIRTTPGKQEILESTLALLEREGIDVERSYGT